MATGETFNHFGNDFGRLCLSMTCECAGFNTKEVDNFLLEIMNSADSHIILIAAALRVSFDSRDSLANWQPLLTNMQETFHDHPLMPEMMEGII